MMWNDRSRPLSAPDVAINVRALALILTLACLGAAPATAQDGGIPSWIEADPFAGGEEDPLGIDREDRLEAVQPTRAEEEVREHVPVQHGEVLWAIAGVREEAHAIDVRLAHGLALVEAELRFVSSARFAAEVRYRLAVPAGASLASLEVCNAQGCRSGLADESVGALGPYDDAVRSHARAPSLPVAHAAIVDDERGRAVWLRAAPVERERRPRGALGQTPPGDGPLTVRVRYLVAAPVRGGRVRLALPPRGRDLRAAPAQIRVRSDELSGARVDARDAVESAVERAAWEPAEITASLAGAPDVELEAFRVRCGARSCVRVRAVAAPRPPRARDVIILLDASPSMHGTGRGRVAPAVATLLASLPAASRVSVAVFAARAEAVVERPVAPAEVSLLEISRALERELGSATRFEAAWALIEPWVARARDPLVVLVGDGGLTSGEASRRAFERVRARGVTLASLDVADRPSTTGLQAALEAAGASALDVGAEAERAAAGRGMDALEERIAELLAPVAARAVRVRIGARTVELGLLSAGEERVFEGEVSGRVRVSSAGRSVDAIEAPEALALGLSDRVGRAAGRPVRLAAIAPASLGRAASCSERSLESASAPVSASVHLVLAEPRRCDEAAPADGAPVSVESAPPPGRIARIASRGGESVLPARSLLDMLRARIVPVARGCFRQDRAGRPRYQTRAVFEFRLADREVLDAAVTGRISAELEACLLRAVDGLEIPPFDGTAQVRYPLVTAAEPPPPVITLAAEVAEAVDAVATDR